MILLTTTSTVLRVVTDAAVAVDVLAIYADKSGASFSVGNQATAISTATTTTVLAAPAASTQRNVKALAIRNTSASAVTVTVEVYDGATAYSVRKQALVANSTLSYEDRQGWRVSSTPSSVTQQIIVAPGAGVYRTPPGVRAIKVECYGAGGGGGGASSGATFGAAGGGGGSGAYATSIIANPSASYSYTVGAGGSPGSGGTTVANPTNGGDGGATSFGGAVIAAGGGGGGAGIWNTPQFGIMSAPGAGGTVAASTGDVKIAGRPGGGGISVIGAAASDQIYPGQGASSRLGTNIAPLNRPQGNNGIVGIDGRFGGGGCGAYMRGSGGACRFQGGSGGNGVLIVTEYR